MAAAFRSVAISDTKHRSIFERLKIELPEVVMGRIAGAEVVNYRPDSHGAQPFKRPGGFLKPVH